MAGRRVRVLADDEHAHAVERLLERPQHVLARGQVPAPGRDLRPQELAHRGYLVRDGLERLGPAWVDDVAQRLCHGQHCIGGHRQNRYRTGRVSRPRPGPQPPLGSREMSLMYPFAGKAITEPVSYAW